MKADKNPPPNKLTAMEFKKWAVVQNKLNVNGGNYIIGISLIVSVDISNRSNVKTGLQTRTINSLHVDKLYWRM